MVADPVVQKLTVSTQDKHSKAYLSFSMHKEELEEPVNALSSFINRLCAAYGKEKEELLDIEGKNRDGTYESLMSKQRLWTYVRRIGIDSNDLEFRVTFKRSNWAWMAAAAGGIAAVAVGVFAMQR
uniref:Uncharacterized protein n=1 Tax=Palpitomonas bilix TaxID=652834 RepID=A0A7S3GC54_9EUKA|mmetsp:Transcript_43047/g.111461  ORF Transcript_43047/g.111461 Transcript_43047/m.111461 type:complete len:126 (+) Transcript_43047:178-555(+)